MTIEQMHEAVREMMKETNLDKKAFMEIMAFGLDEVEQYIKLMDTLNKEGKTLQEYYSSGEVSDRIKEKLPFCVDDYMECVAKMNKNGWNEPDPEWIKALQNAVNQVRFGTIWTMDISDYERDEETPNN